MPIRWHEEDPTLFREAVEFTAGRTGFSVRLVEKDYFCSVVLEYLAAGDETLIFKGGTCLAKVHANFYRLSEDLDFSISTSTESTRRQRRESITAAKELVAGVNGSIPNLRVDSALAGSNESRQYKAVVAYTSPTSSQPETIKIEIGLREPAIEDVHKGNARTMLLNPVGEQTIVEPFPVRSLSQREAMAEKLRAALCRHTVAIRDFFDIDHALRAATLDPDDQDLLSLLLRKLAVPDTPSLDLSEGRIAQLHRQLEAELRPVLRSGDFDEFDLARALECVSRFALAARQSRREAP